MKKNKKNVFLLKEDEEKEGIFIYVVKFKPTFNLTQSFFFFLFFDVKS